MIGESDLKVVIELFQEVAIMKEVKLEVEEVEEEEEGLELEVVEEGIDKSEQ